MDSLPPELLRRILKLSAPTLPSHSFSHPGHSNCVHFAQLSLVCQLWNELSTPLLYIYPSVNCRTGAAAELLRTLESKPSLAKEVRGLGVSLLMPPGEQEKAVEETLRIVKLCGDIELLEVQRAKMDLVELLSAAPSLRALRGLNTTFRIFSNVSISHENLEFFYVHGGTELVSGSIPPHLPQLRHLSYQHNHMSGADPFCFSLSNVTNLDFSIIDGPSPGLRRLFATATQLENLCISHWAWAFGGVLTIFSKSKIQSLFLKGVQNINEVVNLLNKDEPALRSLRELRVQVDQNLKLENRKEFEENMEQELSRDCQRRGITFMGFFANTSESFWRIVEPKVSTSRQ